ncbi:hypothetical protein AYI69_g3042 [Smittium culicis]|uniref:HCP-like protein n=1 Tax=Smittium culicis TaxID=133412 RepID=A0A1R1YKU4_9FUNG|nr:hypothetical protein AYI69_g3042 [Smittium culicis]
MVSEINDGIHIDSSLQYTNANSPKLNSSPKKRLDYTNSATSSTISKSFKTINTSSSEKFTSSLTTVSSSLLSKPISYAKKISSTTAKSITNRISSMKRRYTIICSGIVQNEYNSLINSKKPGPDAPKYSTKSIKKPSVINFKFAKIPNDINIYSDSESETPIGTCSIFNPPQFNASSDTLYINSRSTTVDELPTTRPDSRGFKTINPSNMQTIYKNSDSPNLKQKSLSISEFKTRSCSSLYTHESLQSSRNSTPLAKNLDSLFSELSVTSPSRSPSQYIPASSSKYSSLYSFYNCQNSDNLPAEKSFETVNYNKLKHYSLPVCSLSTINLNDMNSYSQLGLGKRYTSDLAKSQSMSIKPHRSGKYQSPSTHYTSSNSRLHQPKTLPELAFNSINPNAPTFNPSKLVKIEILNKAALDAETESDSSKDLNVDTFYTYPHEHLLYLKNISQTFSSALVSFFGSQNSIKNVRKSVSLFEKLCVYGDINAFAVQQGITILGFCYEFGIGVECNYSKAEKLYTPPAIKGNALAQSRLAFLKKYGRPGVCINRTKAEYWALLVKENTCRESLNWLVSASNEHNLPEAQYALGLCYHDGIGAQTDEKMAFELYLKSAKQGNSRGQGILGYCYGEGFGVKQDKVEAVKWYLLAANQGESVAMYNLGYCYEDGIGVPRNPYLAVEWYKKAAERGNAFAQNSLGYCHEDGLGVRKNSKQAVKWYRLSALQGYPWAECNLGYCYQYGIGIEENPAMATYWYQRAASQGHARAQHNLGYCYQNGIYVEKNEQEAVKWYHKAAAQGNIYAYHSLGYCYQNGAGVTANFQEAVKWYKLAATRNHPPAQLSLGYCYRNGIGLDKDDNQAFKWFQASAKSGNALAQNSLGYCYEEGIGTPQNLKLAFYYYTSSASQNNPWAICNVGYCYSQGIGVAQNLEKAVYLYRVAAKMDHARAMEKLGLALLEGVGIAKNEFQAIMWFKKAAISFNHAPAMHWLGVCYERGLGTAADDNAAILWYQKAISNGDSSAIDRLRACLLKKYKVSKIFDVSNLVVFDIAAPAA